jgi:hypothetical protein
MGDGKTEGNEEQGQLGEIKAIVKRIETNVHGIEDVIEKKMKREREIQIIFAIMMFVFSALLVFLSVTLTSGVGERVYGERWAGIIFTLFTVGELIVLTFFVYKVFVVKEKTEENVEGNKTTSK